VSEPQAGPAVLDASVLLALLHGEPGAATVAEAVGFGAAISVANLAEVLSTFAIRGRDPEDVLGVLKEQGGIGGAITVEPMLEADAIEAARLRPLTKSAGLSLGDRACLALAKRLNAPALTTDGEWLKIPLDVEVLHIRKDEQ
jgi:ribonuclease VapC